MVTLVLKLNVCILGEMYEVCLHCFKCNHKYRWVTLGAVCWFLHPPPLTVPLIKGTTLTHVSVVFTDLHYPQVPDEHSY